MNDLLLVLVLGPWLGLSAYHLLLSLGVLLGRWSWGGFVAVIAVVVGHGWVLNRIRDVCRGGGVWCGGWLVMGMGMEGMPDSVRSGRHNKHASNRTARDLHLHAPHSIREEPIVHLLSPESSSPFHVRSRYR